MGRNLLPMVLVCSSLATTAAAAQANRFDIGAHFGGNVEQVAGAGGDGWLGGVQAALALSDRFDFYPGLSFSGSGDILRPLLAVRAWPLGRDEASFAGWYIGAGMLVDQATFLTGVQVGRGGLQPYLEAQVLSPEVLHLLLGLAIRVK